MFLPFSKSPILYDNSLSVLHPRWVPSSPHEAWAYTRAPPTSSPFGIRKIDGLKIWRSARVGPAVNFPRTFFRLKTPVVAAGAYRVYNRLKRGFGILVPVGIAGDNVMVSMSRISIVAWRVKPSVPPTTNTRRSPGNSALPTAHPPPIRPVASACSGRARASSSQCQVP